MGLLSIHDLEKWRHQSRESSVLLPIISWRLPHGEVRAFIELLHGNLQLILEFKALEDAKHLTIRIGLVDEIQFGEVVFWGFIMQQSGDLRQ